MRIITGLYKGRHFDIPRSFKARPTTDFAKENIFNVLNAYINFEESTALDLFAGTGSISLEMLSRGCRSVISVEKDRDHAKFIAQCINKIGAKNHVLVRGDVFRFIKSCKQQFDFIFFLTKFHQIHVINGTTLFIGICITEFIHSVFSLALSCT